MTAVTEPQETEWHADKRNYDKYLTPDIESRAELFGRLKQLTEQYEHVVVSSRPWSGARAHNREVDPEALSYDSERDVLDICGYPASGRFPTPSKVIGIKLWEDT